MAVKTPKRTKKVLTEKQSVFVDELKRLAPNGLPTSRAVSEAAKKAFDIVESATHTEEQIASTIGNQQLKKPHIAEALGLNERVQSKFFRTMEQMIDGLHPKHPGDKELLLTGMRLLAKYYVPAKSEQTHTDGGFEGRTDEELEFFLAHKKWPEQVEDATDTVQ